MGKGYEVRKTKSKGEGIFATKPFVPDETVIVGKIEKYLPKNTSHASQIGKNIFVLHNEDQTKINHSCSSNCGIRVNLSGAHDIVAMKKIEKGKEITLDYAIRNYDVDFFPKICLCGSDQCRGKVTGWKNLSLEKRKEYINYAAPYLLELA